jgi:hypothetical protein
MKEEVGLLTSKISSSCGEAVAKPYTNYAYRVKGSEVHTRSSDLAARLIIKYEDDNPLYVETQKDFDVVSNRDTDAFCQGIS